MQPPPFSTSVPFTKAELLAAGRSGQILRGDEFAQVMRGVWVEREAWDSLTLIRAALLIHPPSAFASHLSAAEVLGLPVPPHHFAHVTVPDAKHRRFRAEIKTHVTARRRRLMTRGGLRVTDPIATFIDCAGWLDLVDMVILGDALVRCYGVTPEKLMSACRVSDDYYSRLAERAAAYVRPGVDSPMETRLRMLIVLAGLPEPQVDYRLYNDDGTWRRRFDLSYPEIKLIIEYDGRHHLTNVGQWESDLARREEFDDEGYRILVVTASGIFKKPHSTLQRIRQQLVVRGFEDVPELDDGWREYFAA